MGVTTAPLSRAFLDKLDEQIDRLIGIVSQLPRGHLRFSPAMPASSVAPPKCLGELLGHLLQCLAGFLAVLHAAHPDRLARFIDLRQRRVNHFCEEEEALERIAEYQLCIHDGFRVLSDEDLGRTLPTVFVPEGESVFTLLLGNLEHLINHKHEIFVYAKQLGVPLISKDLYRFRTEISRLKTTSSGGDA